MTYQRLLNRKIFPGINHVHVKLFVAQGGRCFLCGLLMECGPYGKHKRPLGWTRDHVHAPSARATAAGATSRWYIMIATVARGTAIRRPMSCYAYGRYMMPL